MNTEEMNHGPGRTIARSFSSRVVRMAIGLTVLVAILLLGVWIGRTSLRTGPALQPNGPVVATAPPSKTVKYACSMMCIPPVDKPGKCPVCGMDMVPVEESGGGTADDSGPSVTLSPRAQRLAEVQTAAVERRFVATEIKLFGKVEFDETRVRSISARVAGRLDRLFVDYTGVRVQKGDHLISLYSPELLTAQEELLQSAKGVQEAQPIGIPVLREAAMRSLAATREKLLLWGLTQEQLDEIEKRGTASDHTTIFAPIGGVVIEKQAVEGMYVEMGDRLYTIADLSSVWVKLDAYESDLAWLRYGQEVEFQSEAYPGEVFRGRISFIDPTLNPKTRTVKVRVNVPNPDGRLKPEMFVRAFVRSKVAPGGKVMDEVLAGKWISPMHPEIVKDAPGVCDVCGMPLVTAESLGYVSAGAAHDVAPLIIPVTAPLLTGKRAMVYVENPDQPATYDGREIELGPRTGEFYLVKGGLREGERVVVNGNVQIDSAVQILGRRSMMSPSVEEAPATVRRSPVDPQLLALLDGVYDAYFVIQDALSHDRLDDAQMGAKRLETALASIKVRDVPTNHQGIWVKEYLPIRATTIDLYSAKNIGGARAAYEHLSNRLIGVVKTFGSSGKQPIRRYHCPMAFNNRGADWLQNKEGLENPYFGAEMFTCGVFKEVIEPGPAGASERGH